MHFQINAVQVNIDCKSSLSSFLNYYKKAKKANKKEKENNKE